MTNKKTARSASDGKNAKPMFGVSGIISVDKFMTYLPRKLAAANPAPVANSGSAANSKIDMNSFENQSCNRIFTTNTIAAIVAVIIIARRMTNHQCAFSKMVSKLIGWLTCSMWLSASVVVSNQGTNTFWRYVFKNVFRRRLFTPAGRSLPRRKNCMCIDLS